MFVTQLNLREVWRSLVLCGRATFVLFVFKLLLLLLFKKKKTLTLKCLLYSDSMSDFPSFAGKKIEAEREGAHVIS